MGSLSSRPKVPKQQVSQPQIVYVPAPQSALPETGAAADTATNDDGAEQSAEQSLLRRNRGRLGTIQTSFRGLLSTTGKTGNTDQRKTLLGE